MQPNFGSICGSYYISKNQSLKMPSPPKARPPFATWAMIKPQRQIQDDMECN